MTATQTIPAEHIQRLNSCTDRQLVAVRQDNARVARQLWAQGDRAQAKFHYAYADACEAILDERAGITAPVVENVAPAPARCEHSDYDANGDCYGCGKHVVRSVGSYL